MKNSSFLEELLLSNKSLSTLFKILKEPKLKFYQVEVLNKIEDVLKSGSSVSNEEKSIYTSDILNVDGDVMTCHRILRLLWKCSGKCIFYLNYSIILLHNTRFLEFSFSIPNKNYVNQKFFIRVEV